MTKTSKRYDKKIGRVPFFAFGFALYIIIFGFGFSLYMTHSSSYVYYILLTACAFFYFYITPTASRSGANYNQFMFFFFFINGIATLYGTIKTLLLHVNNPSSDNFALNLPTHWAWISVILLLAYFILLFGFKYTQIDWPNLRFKLENLHHCFSVEYKKYYMVNHGGDFFKKTGQHLHSKYLNKLLTFIVRLYPILFPLAATSFIWLRGVDQGYPKALIMTGVLIFLTWGLFYMSLIAYIRWRVVYKLEKELGFPLIPTNENDPWSQEEAERAIANSKDGITVNKEQPK
jgi:hypothetical protein